MYEQPLRVQVEKTRSKMYKAYEDGASYEEILILSQQLDYLLNKLRILNNQDNPVK